jgi:tetratricopeptide (TPR) repeat protein
LRPSFLTLLPQTVLYKAFSTKFPVQQHMPQIPSPIPEEEAEEEVSVELEYAPKNEAETHALREIGYLFVLGDFKKAADLCREYLKTESSAAVRTLLGESYQRTGNLQGAMEEYEKAIKTDPSFGVAPKRLGYMYLEAAEREPPGSEKRADLAEKVRDCRMRQQLYFLHIPPFLVFDSKLSVVPLIQYLRELTSTISEMICT